MTVMELLQEAWKNDRFACVGQHTDPIPELSYLGSLARLCNEFIVKGGALTN